MQRFKIGIFPLTLFFTIQFSYSQKALYLELGGSGGLGSINYEKTFINKEKINYLWRAGVSVFPIDKNNGWVIVVPLMVHTLIGKGNHLIELGAGQTISITTKGSFFLRTPLALGYRYQHPDKKLFYRITYTPIISNIIDLQYQHWGGISLGFKLK